MTQPKKRPKQKQKIDPKTKKSEPPFPKDDLKQLASDILRQIRMAGASSAELGLGIGRGYTVAVRMGEVEDIHHHRGKTLDITVYFGKRIGTASTSDFSKKSIHLTIEKACYIARFTNKDPYAGLADAKLMAYNYPDLDLHHAWNLNILDAISLAKKYEAAGLNYDRKITNSGGTTIGNSEALGIYANSHGFLGYVPTTLHSITCCLIAQKKSQMQRDCDYTVARSHQSLLPSKVLGQNAAKHTLRRLGAHHLTTRECPVIFEANLAKTLIGHLLSAASGSNLYNKTSFLCDQLNKQVLAKHLSLDEQPLIPGALGSAAFDHEGVATKPQLIVENGILTRYILGSYTARKLKMHTTGNAGGCYNIFLNTKNKRVDFPTLLQEMGTGLVVIELLGQGVNIATGDYSRGAFGLWVENGRIQYPVEGFTIAGNLKSMLRNIVAMSDDIDTRDTIFTGSLLIPKMHIGGIA